MSRCAAGRTYEHDHSSWWCRGRESTRAGARFPRGVFQLRGPGLLKPASFDESDLRQANRGGARISAAEIAAILERRGKIEHALREIHPAASLADTASAIPWLPLTATLRRIRGHPRVGFSKMTKALHPKRPALIPMLDSVVQAYLTRDDSAAVSSGTFGERATRSSAVTSRSGSKPFGSP